MLLYKQQEVKINMTEELITAADKDRSVPNADKLLTPGSDKAGDLGKAALLPAPDGVPLLEGLAGVVLMRIMRLQITKAAILKTRIFTRKKSLTN